MKYQNIIKFANNENTLSCLFGAQTSYVINKQEDRNELRIMIKSSLSPEHLTWDGQLNARQVKQKKEYLTQCLVELDELDERFSNV